MCDVSCIKQRTFEHELEKESDRRDGRSSLIIT